MQCPIDGSQLVMTDRSGVEIDYCPKCRGVWLDRGELDKIIERSAAQSVPQSAPQFAPPPPPRAAQPAPRPFHDDDDRDYKRKKRGGFLDDLFDF